jgi:hypothetical protein
LQLRASIAAEKDHLGLELEAFRGGGIGGLAGFAPQTGAQHVVIAEPARRVGSQRDGEAGFTDIGNYGGITGGITVGGITVTVYYMGITVNYGDSLLYGRKSRPFSPAPPNQMAQ